MNATPESIAEKYTRMIGQRTADTRTLVEAAIREALAPVEAERDAARSILMEAFVLGVGYVADAVVVGDRVSIGVGKFKTIFDLLAAERDAARADLEVIERAAFDEVRFGRGCEANSPVYCHWYDDGYPYTGTGPTVAAACRNAMEQKGNANA